ncbi:MAG: hypothetical protein J5982_05965 [Bacilli bacterium]|nr:hypothetical protein [Bacilli bacterium]
MDRIFIRFLEISCSCFLWVATFKLGKWILTVKRKNNFLVTKNKKDYVSISNDRYKGVLFVVLIIALIPSLFFTISGLLGVKDVEGNNVIFIAMVFWVIVFLSLILLIYYFRCKIYFNNDEIIKYRFIGHRQKLKFSDVKKVMVKPLSGIVLYSENGKLKVDYDNPNASKLVSILEKKGFIVNYKI